jgi:hypothetical protein
MKMLGEKSVASTLKVILDILIIFVMVLWSVAILFFVIASLSAGEVYHDDYINLHIPYRFEPMEKGQEIQTIPSKLWGMATGMEITRELAFNPTEWWVLFLVIVFVTLVIAVFIFILIQLRNFLETLEVGDPFTKENAGRIRIIGLVIIASELGIKLMMIGGAAIIHAAVRIEGASLIWGELISAFSLPSIFLGIVVLIIAEIFRLGVKMKEDQELTI